MLGWLDTRSLLAAVDSMKMLQLVTAVPSEEILEISMSYLSFLEGIFLTNLRFLKQGEYSRHANSVVH